LTPSPLLLPYTTLFRSLNQFQKLLRGRLHIGHPNRWFTILLGPIHAFIAPSIQGAIVHPMATAQAEPFSHFRGRRLLLLSLYRRSEEHTSELQSRENLV